MSDEKQAIEPMASVRGDARRIKKNTGATAEELKAFLGELRGRSPQEMLGLIAQSSLIKCCITATIAFVVIGGVFTVVPYGMAKMKASKATAQASPEVEAQSTKKPPPAVAAKEPAKPDTKEPEPEDDLVNKLGIGDAIVTPLDSNPLDSTGDDLFNDLK